MTDTFQAPVVKAQMLIRTPVAQVFEALVDPAVTSRFWFSRGSARLAAGRRVRWDWEMYGASAEVDVKEVEENRRILVEWGGSGNPTSVGWTQPAAAVRKRRSAPSAAPPQLLPQIHEEIAWRERALAAR